MSRAAAELGLAAAPAGGAAGQPEQPGSVPRRRPPRRTRTRERIAELETALAEVEAQHGRGIESELAELKQALAGERELLQRLDRAGRAAARGDRARRAGAGADARERLAGSEQRAREARRERERLEAELAAVNQFLRDHARARSADGAPALSEELRVADGFELALAAVLGGRLDAALAEGLEGAQALLDKVGPDGGTVLLSRRPPGGRPRRRATPGRSPGCPAPGRLLELVDGPGPVIEMAERLLSDAWVVERLEELPESFRGVAVTRAGRVWFADAGEVRQLSAGGSERVLARRNERDRLGRDLVAAERALQEAEQHSAGALGELSAAEAAAARALGELRDHERTPGRGAGVRAPHRMADRAAPRGPRPRSAGGPQSPARGRARGRASPAAGGRTRARRA